MIRFIYYYEIWWNYYIIIEYMLVLQIDYDYVIFMKCTHGIRINKEFR